MRYQDVRLSKHFVLMDFMHMRDVYTSRLPLPLETSMSVENLNCGREMCVELLEPMIDQFGPSSVCAGFTPQAIVERNGWLWPQPHRWTEELGAAADLIFHDWVNREWAPIYLCERVDKDQRLQWDRLITYCGSECMCIAFRGKRNRKALYENVRIPGQKYQFKSYGTYPGPRSKRLTLPLPRRPDWRAAPGELISYSTGPRPHHQRVGLYFTVLDFCRSEVGLREGIPYVLPWYGPENPQMDYCRMFASVLDPLVARFGQISVVKGLLAKSIAATDPVGSLHRWIEGVQQIEFLLPQGTDENEVTNLLAARNEVVLLEFEDHPSQTSLVRMQIAPFQPAPWAHHAEPEPEVVTRPMTRRSVQPVAK